MSGPTRSDPPVNLTVGLCPDNSRAPRSPVQSPDDFQFRPRSRDPNPDVSFRSDHRLVGDLAQRHGIGGEFSIGHGVVCRRDVAQAASFTGKAGGGQLTRHTQIATDSRDATPQ